MTDAKRTRREYLALAGTALAAGLAGCSGDGGDESGPATGGPTTDEPTTTGAMDAQNERQRDGDTAAAANPYVQVYQETVSSVALILTPRGALGSGFVFEGGYVVTNNHVVGDAETVVVKWSDGTSATGRVIGTDVYADLAVIEPQSRPDDADSLPLAESEPAIGTKVAVIGSPYGLQGSLTSGIVSSVNRFLQTQDTNFFLPNAIQTDAAVNPGNSGGPLVNLEGVVLGVINSGGGDNIAFAISSPLVSRVVSSIIKTGNYDHPYMGVALVDVTEVVAEANGLQRTRGLLVEDIVDGSPAASELQESTQTQTVSGFTVPTGGDVILEIDGQYVETRQAFYSYLALNTSPGETVELTILRDGEQLTVRVELGARPTP